MPGACGLISGPASSVAQSGLASIQAYASDAITRVITSSETLKAFLDELTPISDDIQLDDVGNLSSPFTRPYKPGRPDMNITVPNLGYNPALRDVQFVRTVSSPGDFTEVAPDLNFGTRPTPVTQTAPGAAPTVPERAMPDAPTNDIPPLPSFRSIIVPTVEQLTLPEFTAARPNDFELGEIPSFSWEEGEYTGQVQTDLVTQIKAILGGSTGIPDAIWDSIWARSRRQILKQARASQEQIKERYSAMGHMVPHGAERKRLKEADDIALDAIGEQARETAVQDAQIYVERLNNALAQGIALEGQLITLHSQQASRALQVAQLIPQIAIEAANIKVAAYNARMAAYAQDAEVFVKVMQGELAKLEKFRAELEAQKLIGELNLQDLEAYKAHLQALQATYGLYTEQVKAVIGQYDADKTRVQAFGEEVKAFEAIHRGKEAEWRGYSETIKAEVAKLEPYKVASDVHLNRIRAYEVGTTADRNALDAEIANENLKLERLRAALDQLRILLQGEVERVNVLRGAYDADARMYAAEGDVERSRVASDDRRFEVMVRNAEIKANNGLKNLELNIRSAENQSQVLLTGNSNILQANTQVGASSLAALNFSASISDGVSNSTNCTTTYEGN